MKPEPPVTAMRTGAIQAGTPSGWPNPPLQRTQTRVDGLFAVFAGLALLAWGTVDAPQSVHVHGVRLSAVITGLTAIIAVTFAVLLSKRTPRSVLRASVPIMAALAAGGIALAMHPRQTGLENFLVYVSFLAMLVSGTAVRWTTTTWRIFTV